MINSIADESPSIKLSRVRSVRRVKLDAPIPVFDVTNLSAQTDADRNFLAEGCVVHNTCKHARDKRYQECLPIRGKIKNAVRAKDIEAILLSEEVLNILTLLGYDPDAEDPLKKLRVGKVILLSDPDPDGHHINCLELGLLWRVMPGLFEQGIVYVARAPEYYAKVGKESVFGRTKEKLRAKLKAMGAPKTTELHHIKGYGEMDAGDLRTVAFDPSTRSLVRVRPTSEENSLLFGKLMAEDTELRRKLMGI